MRPFRRSSQGALGTAKPIIAAKSDLLTALEPVIGAAWTRIARAGASGRTLTLKAKFANFKLVARSRTLAVPLSDCSLIAETGRTLLRSLFPVEQGIRLLGLTLSGLGGDAAPNDEAQPPLNFDVDAERLQAPIKASTTRIVAPQQTGSH